MIKKNMIKKNSRKPRTVRLLSLFLAAVMLLTAQVFTILADTVSVNDAQNLSVEEEAESGEALEKDESESGQADALQDGKTYELTEEAEQNCADALDESAPDRETIMPEGTAAPANPVHHCTKENDGTDYTDFSYVYFGSYPQGEVTDSSVISSIDRAIAEGNAVAGADRTGVDVWVNGTKYRRISKDDTNYSGYFDNVKNNGYRYFKWQRIRWRVLDNNDNGTLFVAADKALDCKYYNDKYTSITWEKSDIRSWLNIGFYKTAFSSAEQSAIAPWHVVNENHPDPFYDTEGGNDTTDHVYLLSIGEVTNERYGFCSDFTVSSVSRRVQPSDYARARGTLTDSDVYGSSDEDQNARLWWLRSPGANGYHAMDVAKYGYGYSLGAEVDFNTAGVVPVLHINPSSDRWLLTDDGTSGEGGGMLGVRLQASQVTSRTDVVPQGASFTVTGSDLANQTVSFDGISDENAAAVAIPKTITYNGVEYKVTTVSPTAFVTKKDNASFTVTDNRVESLIVEYKAPANAKKAKAKTSVPESITYKGIKFKVTSVAAKAFQNNKKVKQISIAASIKKIGDSCFEGCANLKSVTIGKGAVTISKNAFKNCKKLTKITIKSVKLKTVGKNALKGVNAKCKIKVPKKQLKKYQKLFKKKGQKSSVKVVAK